MSRKLIFLGVLSLVLAPGAALSLGLGEIRLNSYLNQPLDAEISLSISSPEERESLRVQMASPEAFARYGLARPAYFDDISFQVRASGPSAATIIVSTSRPVVEPFLTFLVEASWNGGQILREYTVLLDPPVFLPSPEPQAAPAPAVEAPRPAPEAVSRPAPEPPPVAAPAPVARDYDYDTQYGPVQRNETLWAIAQRVRPDASFTTNQVMVALFEANPEAFNGNINRLRAGAILRVPSRDRMAAMTTGQANAEVRRQNQAWSAATAAPAPAPERRLELAPPTETGPEPAPGPAETPAATAPTGLPASGTGGDPVLEAVDALRTELAETRRMMEIKDAEIAALQARLAELESGAAVDGAAAPAEAATETETPAAAPAETPGAEPAAEPAAPAATPPAPVQQPPSFGERILGWLGSLWLWLVLAVVLIVGAIAIFLRKRQEEERSIEEELAETGTWGALEPTGQQLAAGGAGAAAAAAARKITPRKPVPGAEIEVEESAREPATAPRRAEPEQPERKAATSEEGEDYQYPFEDTIASETGINLDQSDPLAEADFHMAYGLYDQAAEIMKKAIAHEPDRYDLRRKLIDICFVWGNAKEFLAQAKSIRETGGAEAEADWSKIAIMGRQICPGEALFEGGADVAVDIDLGAEGGEEVDTAASGSWLDFDVGTPEGEESGVEEPVVPVPDDTQEQRSLSPAKVEQTGELDLDELGIDLDIGESGEYALKDLAERAPEFPEAGEEEPFLEPPEAEEEEGGTMMMDASLLPRGSEDPTQRGEGFELDSDEPTLSGEAGFEVEEDEGTVVEPAPAPPEEDEPTVMDLESELEEETPDQTAVRKVDSLEDETIEQAMQDEDLDLDDLTQVLQAEVGADRALPEEGEATKVAVGFSGGEEADEEEAPPAEGAGALEEMDEVGTKLDLARAYIDMGDPDGARSILEEVAAEGDEAQQQEARELLDSLG
jgi:pilus assembly protein FimV